MFALKIKAYAESAYHDGRITAVYLFTGDVLLNICIGRPCLECRTQSGNSVGENSLLKFSKVGLGEDVSGLFNLLGKIDGTATLFAFFHHEVKPVRRFAGSLSLTRMLFLQLGK